MAAIVYQNRNATYAVLSRAIETYRRADVPRLNPAWSPDELDGFAVECFGVPLRQLGQLSMAEKARDWRVEARREQKARLGV